VVDFFDRKSLFFDKSPNSFDKMRFCFDKSSNSFDKERFCFDKPKYDFLSDWRRPMSRLGLHDVGHEGVITGRDDAFVPLPARSMVSSVTLIPKESLNLHS